jgi:hypothetical protein
MAPDFSHKPPTFSDKLGDFEFARKKKTNLEFKHDLSSFLCNTSTGYF